MYEFKTKLLPFYRGYLNSESTYKGKRIAEGLLLAAKETDFEINFKTGLCSGAIEGFSFGSGVYAPDYEELLEYHPQDSEDIEYIREALKPHLLHLSPEINYNASQKASADEAYIWGGSWMGHAVPDIINLCKYGTYTLREKIVDYRKINAGREEFYDSLDITLDAIEAMGERIFKIAEEKIKNEKNPDHIEKLKKIRDTFSHAPKQPCRDFAEACIVYVTYFSFDGIDSPGHFDQYMYEFWENTDPELRRRYLEAVWQFFQDTRTWNVCISGSDENWNDLTNDLTYEILDLVKTFRYETPNLTMRCHRNTPEKLMYAAYEAIASGTGLPALYNDEAVCPALERLGIPPCDSHRYVMNGCNQIDIQGKSHMGLEDGEVVIAKVLDFTLRDGISGMTGADIGLHTGKPEDFKSYDEFYAAFLKQLDAAVDMATELSNQAQELYSRDAPNPFRSLFIEGCVEKGHDYKAGGPVYGHGQILAEAIADTADSLAAIKKYVFEEKRFTLAELVAALDKNFVGYDEMYHLLKNSELKFGNDIYYVDIIAADFVNHFNQYLMTIPTFRGGYFSGGCSPFVRAPEHGAVTPALPNGKKMGEVLIADSIGATPGFDANGPTALLNSCLKFDHTLAGSGFILNVKFDKEIFLSAHGREAFIALWKTYFNRKGQMLAVTVVSQEELLDAQIHPENHKNLIVRVGGFSDRFIDLDKELQDNVIARTSIKL